MATPEEIAKLLTEDPDVFNEMAVGTGAVGMGPGIKREDDAELILSPKKSSKKRKKITHRKKYHANPVTGQPQDDNGEILYSDIKTEEPDEILEESAGDQAKIAQLLSTSLGSPPLDQWSHGEEMNDVLRRKIVHSFRKAYGALKQAADRLPGGCKFVETWEKHLEYVHHLRKSDAQQTKEPIEWEGNPVETPPRGWWGQKWGVSSQRNYILAYFYEICYNYLTAFQKLVEDHESECADIDCADTQHHKFIIQALCADLVGLDQIWDKLRAERRGEFEEYRYWQKRGKKPIRHQMSKADQDRLEQWKAQDPAERGPMQAEIPDTMADLANWYKLYPRSRQNVFSSGFGEPTFKRGDRVEHSKFGVGQVASTPKELDVYVRVMFDKDLQTAFGQIGPGVAHNVKVRRVRKSDLETQY